MNRAIGLFGRPVAPRLLVAAGVPGDTEEQTGFVKAHVVAAVNHGEAPMLSAADVEYFDMTGHCSQQRQEKLEAPTSHPSGE